MNEKSEVVTDQTKEQIRFNTEMLRITSVFFLAIGGGLIGMIITGIDSGRKVFFTAAGIIAIFVCILIFSNMLSATRKLLKQN